MKEDFQYRKVQGLIGETSFSIILPKVYAINLGIGKGDFVKVSQEERRIVIEKAWKGEKKRNEFQFHYTRNYYTEWL